MVHLQLEFTPVVLFAVFVAEWRSGGLARRSSGGPAHQVVKSVGLTLLFLDSIFLKEQILEKSQKKTLRLQ